MRALWLRPAAWIVHVLFFAACVTYAALRFDGAFPIVNLRVKLDRAAALKAAETIFAERHYPPQSAPGSLPPRFAVSFDTDSAAQNYIELEAGGAAAFARAVAAAEGPDGGGYSPYGWRVRGFAEGQTNETSLRFLPDGRLRGFAVRLAEDDPGAALGEADARRIAEQASARDFAVGLADYRLVEHSQERARGGRVDHVFTYEHARVRYGEAPLRLKLEVSGDRLTEVTRFLKIPDAFSRRYAELRSGNTTIATVAMTLIALLYGLAGCLGGLVWLSRRGGFADAAGRGVFRAALGVSAGIALFHLADELDGIPQAWLGYDTAIAAGDFWLKQLVDAVVGSLLHFVSLFLPILAALGLSRAAFPAQPALAWACTRRGLASRAVFGRVLGAYLTVGFHFAFVVWIYRMGSTRWGWWNPSDLLFHPDALAAPLPWLTSVASSLHAGIWEECLFRAVPLAGFALLLDRTRLGRNLASSGGRRFAAFALAMVAQALIFGAGHASYPTQPAYARVVELMVPSFVFGTAYLGFGLIPGMIMHYLYDVVLFAMPVFMTAGTGARVSQAVVVGLSLVPLVSVVYARLRQGRWTTAQEAAAIETAGETPVENAPADAPAPGLPRGGRRGVVVAAVLGLAAWLAWGRAAPDAPFPTIARAEAVSLASRALAAEGVNLGPEWRPLATLDGSPDEDDLFVWKAAGPARYREWMRRFLAPPMWRVRWVRTEGKVEDRAEEYAMILTGEGIPYRFRHELPEARAGRTMEEAEARRLAERELRRRFGVGAEELEPVSSSPSALPGRRDWFFVWKDPREKVAEGGEGRYAVKVAGDEISYYRQYVEVPERWQRQERQRRAFLGIVRGAAGALAGLLALFVLWQASLGAVRAAGGRGFSMPVFGRVFALALVGQTLLALNRAPERLAAFVTSQPWSSQLFRLALGEAVWALCAALGLAALWGRAAAGDLTDRDGVGKWLAWPLAGLGAGFAAWAHQSAPFWAVPGALAHAWPPLAGLSPLFMFGAVAAFFVIFSQNRRSDRALQARLFALALGFALGAWSGGETLAGLAGSAALWGAGFAVLAELAAWTGPGLWIGLVGMQAVLARAQELRIYGWTPGGQVALAGLAALGGLFFMLKKLLTPVLAARSSK